MTDPNSSMVFLCHSSTDKQQVRALYSRLVSSGIRTWFDEEDLLPGQDWSGEISRAIYASSFILVCLSRSSINRRGYISREIRLALDIADSKPEGSVYVVPVRLEECAIPDRLSRFQSVDLFLGGQFERLARTVRRAMPLPARAVARPMAQAVEAAVSVPQDSGHNDDEPSGVFISYRRTDEPAFSGRLYDTLVIRFGEERVFMDVDSIVLGVDFVEVLEKTLSVCKAMVVVIGRHWLRAADEVGRRRLDDPDDFVRLEVATALEREINVIPILVEHSWMPRREDLPACLYKLPRRNGRTMTNAGFRRECVELLERLETVLR